MEDLSGHGDHIGMLAPLVSGPDSNLQPAAMAASGLAGLPSMGNEHEQQGMDAGEAVAHSNDRPLDLSLDQIKCAGKVRAIGAPTCLCGSVLLGNVKSCPCMRAGSPCSSLLLTENGSR
jgi:hypothetical protein